VYTKYIPKGKTVNAEYVKKAQARFPKVFREKRPIMLSQEWFLHWDNTLVHTAASVQNYLTAKGVQMICHLPYSLDLAPSDFILFERVKSELAGLSMTQESFQKSGEGIIQSIPRDDFAEAFEQWMEQSEKCLWIGCDYVEK
jgi:histone-lysine N-methyltransferase SETMAR